MYGRTGTAADEHGFLKRQKRGEDCFVSCRIVHVSDTHLGYTEFDRVTKDGINCREADFYASFSRIVDDILELKPDAVVHTGDFFHRPSPANRPLIEGLTQIKRITDAKIPVVVIAGNHSTPRTVFTSPILRAFRSIDHVHAVFEQRYEKVLVNDMAFHGLPHINDEDACAEEMGKISPVNGKINVALLHMSVGKNYLMDEYGERVFTVERMSFLDECDYTAIGHWHNTQMVPKLKCAWYSGSTERLSDREAESDKGYIVAEFDGNGAASITFHPVAVRPWRRFDIRACGEKSVEEIQREITAAGESSTEGSLVSVYFHGIKPDQSAAISNIWITGQFPGALAVLHRRIFQKARQYMPVMEEKGETLENIFNEYLRKNVNGDAEYEELRAQSQKYFHRHATGE